MPTKIGATKAAIPISGFGNPRRAACSLSITDLQLNMGDMSQEVLAAGFAATWRRSSVKPKLAIQPITPIEIRAIGNSMLQLSHFGNKSWHTYQRCIHTYIKDFFRRAMCPEE